LLKENEITALDDEERIMFGIGAWIVRFSSDGRQVIIGSESGCVFIWDWQYHDVPLKNVTLPAVRTVEITCDGNMIYTCSEDMTVCQIDLGSLKVSTVCRGPYSDRIPVVITPDGKAILSRKVSDNSLIYYEFSTDSEVAYIAGK
jgi:WD40 repeat protein